MPHHFAFIAVIPFVIAFIVALVVGARAMTRWSPAQPDSTPDMKLVSTTTMIQRLQGLLDTRDLTEWEQEFVRKLAAEAQAGRTTDLTGPQVEKLDELHGRHFA